MYIAMHKSAINEKKMPGIWKRAGRGVWENLEGEKGKVKLYN